MAYNWDDLADDADIDAIRTKLKSLLAEIKQRIELHDLLDDDGSVQMDDKKREELLIRMDERIKNIYNRMDKFETLFTNHLTHHEMWENDMKTSVHRWLAAIVAAAGGAGAMGMM